VARSGQSGIERPEQFEAEQKDADACLHWTHGDDPSSADVEEQRACQRACQRASRLYQKAQNLTGVEMWLKKYDGDSCTGDRESYA
jgi:hypothetical protein